MRLFHDHLLVKEAGTLDRSPWHQDQPYYPIDGTQTWVSRHVDEAAAQADFASTQSVGQSRMAQLHANGELALGEPFVNESPIGTRFTGRLVEETRVGSLEAVVPEITGRAWITGMGQYLLDPTDPFPAGFLL